MIYTHALDPVMLSLGPVQLHWYGLMYALSFFCGWLWLRRAAAAGRVSLSADDIETLLFALLLGVILGGRLGHFLFYEQEVLFTDPLQFFQVWQGGMSFHGGLLGVTVSLFWATQRFQMPLLRLADLILPPVALGLSFGRLGNFINGELWGVPTNSSWGVIFPQAGDLLARHPSQLYEAAYSLLIFIVLFWLFRHTARAGQITFTFLVLYGLFRMIVETCWREPIAGFIGPLTTGAAYSLPLFLVGVGGLIVLQRK